MPSDYPEHEKLSEVSDKSQAIGEFIDWLEYEKGIHLGFYPDGQEPMQAVFMNIRDLLADFFEIDLDKIDLEKDAMLEAMRKVI